MTHKFSDLTNPANYLPKMPKFTKTGKNAFEIRANFLEIAKELEVGKYNVDLANYKMRIEKTKDNVGEVVQEITFPDFPGVDQILNTATQMVNWMESFQPKPTEAKGKEKA
jgi:hypothetical protein